MVINSRRKNKERSIMSCFVDGHRIRVEYNYINRGVHTVRVIVSISARVRVRVIVNFSTRVRVRVKCTLKKCCTPYIYIYGVHVLASKSKRLLTHAMI